MVRQSIAHLLAFLQYCNNAAGLSFHLPAPLLVIDFSTRSPNLAFNVRTPVTDLPANPLEVLRCAPPTPLYDVV
ncbi:hypothetical protein DFH08DRAFT_875150 [Mycena albidolilacea]|uniref:Uncharacterized protein n=1 Tax=Mycena albidolilacea TaxID=1033008 RepID=A0AAD6ZW13_9AGAR|nr:hypothetical protein DFH08DRAFT_875150 [Mycena albidolilacea]